MGASQRIPNAVDRQELIGKTVVGRQELTGKTVVDRQELIGKTVVNRQELTGKDFTLIPILSLIRGWGNSQERP